MSKYETRPVGEVFRYGKNKLQVVESNKCRECFFCGQDECEIDIDKTGYCASRERDDRKDVIFKRIMKEL